MNPTSIASPIVRSLPVSVLLAASCLTSHAATTVLFSDDFGTSETPGVVSDYGYWGLASSGATPWSIRTDAQTGNVMSGNYLQSGGSTANVNMIKQWFNTPVTLSNVGDSLSVSFDVDSRNAYTSGALNLIVALYDSTVAYAENRSAGVNPLAGKVSGYGYFQSVAENAAIYRYTDYDTRVALGASAPAPVTSPSGIYDQALHTVNYTITKAALGATFTFSYDNSIVYTHTDTTATALTFDTLRLNVAGAGGGGAWMDNISATFTSQVPEPSSYALLAGVAGLAFTGLRRRPRAA